MVRLERVAFDDVRLSLYANKADTAVPTAHYALDPLPALGDLVSFGAELVQEDGAWVINVLLEGDVVLTHTPSSDVITYYSGDTRYGISIDPGNTTQRDRMGFESYKHEVAE